MRGLSPIVLLKSFSFQQRITNPSISRHFTSYRGSGGGQTETELPMGLKEQIHQCLTGKAPRDSASPHTHPRIILLDGGTGEELFRRGVPDDRQIWSAKAVVDSQYHNILKEVHKVSFDFSSSLYAREKKTM
jgi:hypothetical protein